MDFSASATPIEFRTLVPANLRSLFHGNTTDTLPPSEIIGKLREMIPYRSEIKVKDYEAVYKRFTKIHSSPQEKKEMTQLIAKILFGSGNSSLEGTVDNLLDQDFQSSTNPEGHLSINLSPLCELLTNTPPEHINPNLIIRFLELQKNTSSSERKILYDELSKIPPERREFVIAATAPWLEKFSIPISAQALFLSWVDKGLGPEAPEIISKCLPALLEHALSHLPKDAIDRPIPISSDDFDNHIKLFITALGFPPEDRANNLNFYLDTLRVVKGLNYTEETLKSLENTLKNILPPAHRTAIVDLAIPYLSKFAIIDDREYLIRCLSKLSENERKQFDIKYKPFLEKATSLMDLAAIFNSLPKIPYDQWDDVLKNAQLLQSNPTDPNNIFFLTLVHEIDAVERENVVKSALPFIRNFTSIIDIEKIIKEIEEIPSASRKSVLENALPLIHPGIKSHNVVKILANLSHIPVETDWKQLQVHCEFLLALVSSPVDKSVILFVTGNIPPKRRTEVLTMAERAFQKKDYPEKIEQDHIPDTKLEILKYTAEIELKNESDVMEIIGLMQVAVHIPPSRWDILIKRMEDLWKQDGNPKNKVKLIKCLEKIPEEDWANIYNWSQPFLAECKFVDEKITILEAMQLIPESERAEIIAMSKPLTNEASNQMIVATILSSVYNMPPHERQDVIDKTKNYVTHFDHHSFLEEFMALTSVIRPPERTPENLALIAGLAETEDLILSVSFCLTFMAPSKRVELISNLSKGIKENENYFEDLNLLEHLYLSDPDTKKVSHEFLSKALDAALANNNSQARTLANEIMEHAEDLQLYEAHPLIQKAAHVYVLSTPEAILDKKNPHRVFKKIREIASEPFIPFTPPSVTKVYEVQKQSSLEEAPSKEKLEVTISLNLDFMRTKAKERKDYTFADLPEGINSETIKNLFSKLQARYEGLSPKVQKQIKDFILTEYLDTLENLAANLLKKPLINDLISQTGNPSDVVSKNTFYLFSVLKAIEETNLDIFESGLTRQETYLLTFAKTLQDCSGGQQDGIRVVFRLLDIQYRHPLSEAQIMSVETVNDLMRESVQKVLADVFQGDALIKNSIKKVLKEKYEGEELREALMKIENIEQATHQTLYLVNILSKDVGHEHEPEFDLHTTTIYTELIDLEIKDILQIFIQECPPNRIINQFRHDIAQLIENDNKKIEADLKQKLETFKSDKPGVNKAIQEVLAEYQLGKKRLTHLATANINLMNVKNLISYSRTLLAIQEYFETQVPANKLKSNWRDKYLDFIDDGEFYPVQGITELGAIELLSLGKYLNKSEGSAVSNSTKREFEGDLPPAKSQKNDNASPFAAPLSPNLKRSADEEQRPAKILKTEKEK